VTPAAVTIGAGKTCNIKCIPQTISQTQASRVVTHAASARPVWFPGNKRPEHLVGALEAGSAACAASAQCDHERCGHIHSFQCVHFLLHNRTATSLTPPETSASTRCPWAATQQR
jgi:hypothetical protein